MTLTTYNYTYFLKIKGLKALKNKINNHIIQFYNGIITVLLPFSCFVFFVFCKAHI